MVKKLTQKAVDAMGDGIHRIDDCLYLRVRGAYRYFFYRYQIEGVRRDISIGSTRKIDLITAKAKAGQLRTEIILNKRDGVLGIQRDTKTTFEQYAPKAVERIALVRGWTKKRLATVNAALSTHIMPVIGKVKLSKITPEMIADCLRPYWNSKSISSATTCYLMAVRAILDHAETEKRIRFNPADSKHLKPLLPPVKKVTSTEHRIAPTFEEARKIAQEIGTGDETGRLILLLLFTAARLGEIVEGQWSEFDPGKAIFSVPKERRKDRMNETFRIPLSTQAMSVFATMEKKDALLFYPLRTRNASSIRCMKRIKKLLGRKIHLHGFRSTFSDWCAENGKDVVTAEKCLMHTTGNAVHQAYQRSDLLEQRRVLLQEWADALTK